MANPRIKENGRSKDLVAAAKRFEKIDNKQIIGHSRIVPAGGQAVNTYTLEDDTVVHEDDAGNTLLNDAVFYQKRPILEKGA